MPPIEEPFGLASPDPGENIAATLARVLPAPGRLAEIKPDGGGSIVHCAVPKGFNIHVIDDEKLLANPRRMKGIATFSDAASFLAYTKLHAASGRSAVWCEFDPQVFKLKFTSVFDEHAGVYGEEPRPGWREHRAVYQPAMSHEWTTWSSNNLSGKAKEQLAFALFIEDNIDDIADAEGFPTGQQMYAMATNFEATNDSRLKSAVRAQSGGVRIEYVDSENEESVVRMELFKQFRIGIPVFWAGHGYGITAKLRYRNNSGKLAFWYELQRPDKVYDHAARDLIEQVREGIGGLPQLMGNVGP